MITWSDLYNAGPSAGAPGSPGSPGSPGAPGVQGQSGNTGAQGATGTGTQGPQGIQGPSGNTGPQGPPGTGAQGPQGIQGPSGNTGPQGPPGTGAQGPQGVQGPSGNTGPQGATGAQGPQGVQGQTGNSGPPGPPTPSANTGNLLTIGTDNLLYLPPSALDAEIEIIRLRSFNAIGNATFEIDARTVFAGASVGAGVSSYPFVLDRWIAGKNGLSTGAFSAIGKSEKVVVPGTNFLITQNFLRVTVTAQQTSLAAADNMIVLQTIESPQLRELIGDVHSVQLLVRSSVATSFGLSLRDAVSTRSLTKLGAISSPNTWTLIVLPNLPIWDSGGNWGGGVGGTSFPPGAVGYAFAICLAAGSTYVAPANNTWQSGNYMGAVGQSNFFASPVNSTFDIAFIQHEPGAVCTTLIDKPLQENLDECLRYFCKSCDYDQSITTANATGGMSAIGTSPASTNLPVIARFPKPMAKTPTVNIYDASNGALNSIWNASAGAHVAVTGPISTSGAQLGKTGFTWIVLNATPAAAGNWYNFGYTADTGW